MSTLEAAKINLTQNHWESIHLNGVSKKIADLKSKVEFKRPALTSTTNIPANLVNGTARLSIKSQDVPLKKTNSKPRVIKKKTNDENVAPKCEEKTKPASKIPRLSMASKSAHQAISTVSTGSKLPSIETNISKPQISQAVATVVETKPSYSTRILPSCVEDIDEGDAGNPYLAPEYVEDIYNHLRYLESKQQIKADFLSCQKNMTPEMRAILVDWLIGIHYNFRLAHDTLYMTVATADRFLQKEPVVREKIQLVGVTALFIAAKFEEVRPVDINDLIRLCDGLYHKRDIFKMEMAILKTLRFDLGRPAPLHFLRRYSKAAHVDTRIHTMAKFLIELSLLEYECASWEPSLVAAVSIYVTLKMVGVCDWNATMEYYTHYSEQKLLPYASILCQIILRSPKAKLQTVRQKYSSSKFLRVSVATELGSQIIQDLARINPTKLR